MANLYERVAESGACPWCVDAESGGPVPGDEIEWGRHDNCACVIAPVGAGDDVRAALGQPSLSQLVSAAERLAEEWIAAYRAGDTETAARLAAELNEAGTRIRKGKRGRTEFERIRARIAAARLPR